MTDEQKIKQYQEFANSISFDELFFVLSILNWHVNKNPKKQHTTAINN